ncbi:MAG: ATP-binding cassette domain-containing protein [Candidatus Baltobacteraceae bacterium]
MSGGSAVIRIAGLVKRYGDLEAVRGVDLAIARGELFGLIGPDGAGKTTCFHILAGVMEPSAGEVTVLGLPPREARSDVGYLTQQFSLYPDLSVDENLRYAAGLRDVPEEAFAERRSRYLRLMNLEFAAGRLAGQLSGGMKQKLALCCALIAEPKILLLDEPTTGVDPVSRRELWQILATLALRGMTIVAATPYLDEAERCDRVGLMYGGAIHQLGTPAQLQASLGLVRLEVRAEDVPGALAALERASAAEAGGEPAGEAEIADVQGFGDRVDALVRDAAAGERAVRAALAGAKVAAGPIDAAEPTLENVFVARLRSLGLAPSFVPFPHSRVAHERDGDRAGSRGPGDDVAIRGQGLGKAFGSFHAVEDVSFAVRYGEIYGLLGANGAGKTTVIKMLCGLLEPSAGTVSLAGRSDRLRAQSLRRRIGYMSQKFTLYDTLTIGENLDFYAGVYGIARAERRAKIDWVLEIAGLRGQERLLTAKLPGGWKQRVAFGSAVMHEPEILFLDEPTSGVDPLARRQFWRLIEDFAQSGTAVLVTTHYLEEAEHCHRMSFMVDGRIVAEGSPSEIKAAQPGQLYELAVDRPQEALETLLRRHEPWRVALFGSRIHLVVDDEAQLAATRAELAARGIAVGAVRALPFSLEDAFIGTVARAQRQAA